MKTFIAADHRARHQLPEILQAFPRTLRQLFDEKSPPPDDYVTVTIALCERVLAARAFGLLLCGNGIGISIVANKHEGIYAARCLSVSDALSAKRKNSANVICLSAETPVLSNIEIVQACLDSRVQEDCDVRMELIRNLEQRRFSRGVQNWEHSKTTIEVSRLPAPGERVSPRQSSARIKDEPVSKLRLLLGKTFDID